MSEIKNFHRKIAQILLNEWDPAGVVDEPGAQDEYDTYAMQLVGLLARGASEQEICEFLDMILDTQFEMNPEVIGSRSAAKAIVALRPK